MQLEQMASQFDALSYDEELTSLEQERERLADKRLRLQDHFSLRLSSIKMQHNEVRAEIKLIANNYQRKLF